MTIAPRIALFHPALIHGGIQRVFANLAVGFHERGYRVDLVQATDLGDFHPSLDGVRRVDLHASRAMTSISPLARYLRRERPDVLIAGASQTNVAAVLARAFSRVQVKLVLTEHNHIRLTTEHADTVRGRMTPHLTRIFYPSADSIVAVSEAIATELQRVTGLPRERIRVVYNPVLVPEIETLAKHAVDHPWFGAGEPPVILAAGRLTRAKDYPTLLRAFALLRRETAARLMILGEGEERSQLEQLIRDLGLAEAVALPGAVANPYAFMRRAALFVLSSRFEGLPTVLVEALSLGTPCVATDAPGGTAEIMGQRERLVPVGNPEALAKAMAEALAHPPAAPSPESLDRFRLLAATKGYLDVLGLPYAWTTAAAGTSDR